MERYLNVYERANRLRRVKMHKTHQWLLDVQLGDQLEQ